MKKNFFQRAKLSSEKHLVAIRDAFIAILPVTMVEFNSSTFKCFHRDLPRDYGNEAFVEFMGPLINIIGIV